MKNLAPRWTLMGAKKFVSLEEGNLNMLSLVFGVSRIKPLYSHFGLFLETEAHGIYNFSTEFPVLNYNVFSFLFKCKDLKKMFAN